MEFDQAVDGFGAAVVGAAGVEVAEELSAHCRRVRPRRAISGIGQLANVSRTWIAIRRPAAWLVW